MRDEDEPLTEEQEREVAVVVERLRELGSYARDWRVEEAVLRDDALLAAHVMARQMWLSAGKWLRPDPEEWWPWEHIQRLPHPSDDPEMSFLLPAYALRRTLDAGADPADLKEIVGWVVRDILYGGMRILGHGRAWRGAEDLPGWRLMEVDANGELTGRALSDLVNVLVDAYPWRGDPPEDADAGGDEADGNLATAEQDEAESA